MKFVYPKEELQDRKAAGKSGFLLTNGLGGYCSLSGVFSAPRADQGVLVAAVKAPNERITMVHRLSERLCWDNGGTYLSAQDFADETAREDGEKTLVRFAVDPLPVWEYDAEKVKVERRCCMHWETNAVSVLYRLENTGAKACCLEITPFFKLAPKETALEGKKALTLSGSRVSDGTWQVRICTDGMLEERESLWQTLSYPEDAEDGRPDRGMAGSCCVITKKLPAGCAATLEVTFCLEESCQSGWDALKEAQMRLERLAEACPVKDPVARRLAVSADAYIARRDSTNGKTILAGYPLFSDWGRDTMIALPGCCLATGRYEEAKSILRTFLAYEKDGLVPNLFPEGETKPMYNTVDAALLLIDCVWQYVRRTGDLEFLREAWPVMERIVACYEKGTHHGIGMDEDGLIYAGQGLDQVTWMDVCVQGVLPTPRHGKPVEINAYWYNALMILARLGREGGLPWEHYEALAQKVKKSFTEKFYNEKNGCLRDVLSGTQADDQIRCNQIWALSMSFTMLDPEREYSVLETVRRHLYTPYGLRTLSPEDPQFHGFYGGCQFDRDMAYHQGTVWVFPLGAYYRACLKCGGTASVAEVKKGLENIAVMMRRGSAGQLPEIYDGMDPGEGKGCFAQAWSVGEILRVYEDLQKLQEGSK